MGNITNLYNRVEDLERKICCTTRFFDTFEDFPPVGKQGVLYVDKETGTIYLWNEITSSFISESKIVFTNTLPMPGLIGVLYVDDITGIISTWSSTLNTYVSTESSLLLFQVGIPSAAHIHWAALTGNQAKQLIQNTNGTIPVADPLQPFVVVTTESNGNPGDEHVHDLTIYFDYVNHTFIVTDISNNVLDNHEAHLIGAGGGVPNLVANQIAYGDGGGLMTSSSDLVVDDSGGAGSTKFGINTDNPFFALHVEGETYLGSAASETAFQVISNGSGAIVVNSLDKWIKFDPSGDGYKVGIGTNVPSVVLDVVGDVKLANSGFFEGVVAKIGDHSGNSDGGYFRVTSTTANFYYGENDIFGIQENVKAYFKNPESDLKVGINTNTPSVTLDVVGTVNISQVLKLASTNYASLPTGVRGMLAHIYDSDTNTWGGVISGGGANTVLAFYNGSNWTVMGI